MKRTTTLATLAVFVLFAAGCADPATAPTSPSSLPGSSASDAAAPAPTADLLAGTWTLRSLQPAGDVDQPTPAEAGYTLTFADGRLSTRVDCNMCGGAFTLSGFTLTAGPALACTRAFCPTMTFGSAYERLLSGESTVALSNGALVLSSARGILRFTR